jgi:K+/H+ antiporter YhaU regulatory subunit KhtT
VINTGDMLVAIGTPGALERLESMFQPLAVPAS